MPLSEKVRVEVYLPDALQTKYQDMLRELAQEFTYTFGGCTRVEGLGGSYLAQDGWIISESVNLLYADISFRLEGQRVLVERYADEIRKIVFAALDEEAILVVVHSVLHSE